MKITVDGGPRWQWRNLPLPEPHLGLLAVGLILHRLQPRMLLSEGRLRLVTGGPFITVGAVLVGWATSAIGNIDLADPDRLITIGPYAVSRHPMYTGWTSIYLGVALVANARWLTILSPLLFALVHRTVLAEEHQLEKRLGDGYRAYKKQVRRYL
jgi:protein-S-isoprenylcysteine O-methyltransferase Ste14